mgnify:CR=1 FL=1
MKILHVLDHSVPLQSGYSFRTLGILREQNRLGWETVHLTTPRHVAPGPDPETVDGLVFHRTRAAPRRSALPGLAELAEMRATAARLEEIARRCRPDILHAHSPVLNALPTLRVGRRLGLPVVYEVRAFWEDAAVSANDGAASGLRYRLSKAAESFALRRADAITTICEGLRSDMVRRGIPAEKITVVPNAVDAQRFDPDRRRDAELAARLGLDCEIVLGFIGSFYRYEGLDILIRAMTELRKRRPGVRLLLAGGGPEDAVLRQLSAALGLEDTVIFAGRVPHDEVDRLYSLVDLFVYPRRRMRLTELVTPLKPLESMAMRRVVAASNVGGHRELIADGTGYLFDADNIDDLVATLDRAIGERQNWPEITRRALEYVRTKRSWASSVSRYEPVYRSLLARQSERRQD